MIFCKDLSPLPFTLPITLLLTITQKSDRKPYTSKRLRFKLTVLPVKVQKWKRVEKTCKKCYARKRVVVVGRGERKKKKSFQTSKFLFSNFAWIFWSEIFTLPLRVAGGWVFRVTRRSVTFRKKGIRIHCRTVYGIFLRKFVPFYIYCAPRV